MIGRSVSAMRMLAIVCFALSVSADAVCAGETVNAETGEEPLRRERGAVEESSHGAPFSKGKVHVLAAGSYFQDISRPASNASKLAGLEVGFSLFVLDNLSLGTELQFTDVLEPRTADAFFSGGDFSIRWHFLTMGRVSLFLEGALGLAGSTAGVPAPDGTQFNFYQRVGNGITVRFTNSLFGFCSVGFMHLSNANMEGPEHNPTLNCLGGRVGLQVFLGSLYP